MGRRKAVSVEQHCRDLLTAALADGAVRERRAWDIGDPDPQARTAGELVTMANLLDEILRKAAAFQRKQSAAVARREAKLMCRDADSIQYRVGHAIASAIEAEP